MSVTWRKKKRWSMVSTEMNKNEQEKPIRCRSERKQKRSHIRKRHQWIWHKRYTSLRGERPNQALGSPQQNEQHEIKDVIWGVTLGEVVRKESRGKVVIWKVGKKWTKHDQLGLGKRYEKWHKLLPSLINVPKKVINQTLFDNEKNEETWDNKHKGLSSIYQFLYKSMDLLSLRTPLHFEDKVEAMKGEKENTKVIKLKW